jgi:hypothetical protein
MNKYHDLSDKICSVCHAPLPPLLEIYLDAHFVIFVYYIRVQDQKSMIKVLKFDIPRKAKPWDFFKEKSTVGQ